MANTSVTVVTSAANAANVVTREVVVTLTPAQALMLARIFDGLRGAGTIPGQQHAEAIRYLLDNLA